MVPDTLQIFRMSLCWPIIVGSTAFLAVRLFWLMMFGRTGRAETTASSLVFMGAVVTTAAISRNWDNSPRYWTAFTVGLAFMAAALLANVIYMVITEDGEDGEQA